MKIFLSLAIAAGLAGTALADDPPLSAPAADILKLSEAGLSVAVIEAFIAASTNASSPTAAEIIYLRMEGVPDDVVTAMDRRWTEARRAARSTGVGGATTIPTPATRPADSYPAKTNEPTATPSTPDDSTPAGSPPAPEVADEPYPGFDPADYYWEPGCWGWGGGGWVWIRPRWEHRGNGGFRGAYGYHGPGGEGFHGVLRSGQGGRGFSVGDGAFHSGGIAGHGGFHGGGAGGTFHSGGGITGGGGGGSHGGGGSGGGGGHK